MSTTQHQDLASADSHEAIVSDDLSSGSSKVDNLASDSPKPVALMSGDLASADAKPDNPLSADPAFQALLEQFSQSRRSLRIADAHLRKVLAGDAYLLFDGAMGTQLQARGLAAGALPELECISNPDTIVDIHASYVHAGAQVITTNTFGANRLKLAGAASVDEVFAAAITCARNAGAQYVAVDIGPTGALLQPMGTLSFDEAYELFAEQMRAAQRYGADIILIETMADLAEAKAALLAAREYTDVPVFVTMTFGEDGRTFLGTTPEVAAATLSALGADAVGINCSLGPEDLVPLLARMTAWADCPLMVQANAGLPSVKDGETVYSIDADSYATSVARMLDLGVTIIGGCCGTTPEYTRGECVLVEEREIIHHEVKDDFRAASPQELIAIPQGHVGVIGERINPTGKKKLKQALRTGNFDFIMGEAISQTRAHSQILDVNAGLPEIDEVATLVRLVDDLQSVTTLPLQIDSSDPVAIEAAVRRYPGKPVINSTNGKIETLEVVLPIAKKYGCAIVGLTLDEEGIPKTAEGRLAIARKIVAATDAIGISRHDVIIDCLAMAASTDQTAPAAILGGISSVKREFPGVRTVLGVSNISFGLPFRELVNATFLSAAFASGLDLCIINPLSARSMDVVASWRVLSGEDESAQSYVAGYAHRTDAQTAPRQGNVGAPGGVSGGFAGGQTGSNSSGEQAGSSSSVDSAGGQAAGSARMANSGDPQGQSTGGQARVTTTSNPSVQGGQQLSESTQFSLGEETLEAKAHCCVLEGRRGAIPDIVAELLASHDSMYVINEVLIPALDEVGALFESGEFFLPQLMASAEAAKAGFDVIRDHASADDAVESKGKVAVATVRGDIHDIGKNIVRMLLENYGYDVLDLGRDVEPQVFVDAVVRDHVELAGLSALMTTTVRGMSDTIELLREQAPWCKVMVGGAVLNPEYAQMVGADFYAKDAQESARIAARVLG